MPDMKKFYLVRAQCRCMQCPEKAYLQVWSEEEKGYGIVAEFLDDPRMDNGILGNDDKPDILNLFIEFLKEKNLLEYVKIDEDLETEEK